MALPKLFQRIFWHNNTTPAINEDNLNAMSKAIDDIDNRVIVLGDDVITVIPQIRAYLEQAEDLVEAMELLSENPPYIGQNGNWWVWDTNTSAFVDSGVDASISVNIADITMLAPNATPYVTNSGTDTDPIFHLFIPMGQTGNGISTIAKTGTSGLVDTYTITMTDGTTSTFTVTNGAGDMNKSVYDSDNTVANAGGIKAFVNGEVEDVYEVMGQNGAKNKIPLTLENLKAANTNGVWNENVCTITDVTFTVNTDNNGFVTSIVANGTAAENRNFDATVTLPAGSYIGNGCPVGGSGDSYRIAFYNETETNTRVDTGNGIGLNPNAESSYLVHMQIRSGYTANNIVFKPMIRDARDPDPTFESYAETNQQLTSKTDGLWDNMLENGAVNLLPNNTTAHTDNGITYTVNDDKSIVASGTAISQATSTLYLFGSQSAAVKNIFKGKKLTGCPSGGATNTYSLVAQGFASSTPQSANSYYDTGDGVIIGDDEYIRVYLRVQNNYAISGSLTYKPMLSDPSLNLSYGDYVPYAMTNRELTENNNDLNTKMSYINPTNVNMNVYMTSDAVPSWGNFTTQDATDIAQAMYDLYKKIGGEPVIRFGKLSYIWRKKSDGSQLGSGNGSVELINAGSNYETCLADNSKMRMRISLKDYGYCMTTDYALWGSNFTYLRRGTDANGTVIDYHQKETIGTISTFVG